MSFLNILLGTSFLLPVLAAFLWSASQSFRQTGWLRLAHAAATVLTILGIAAISYDIDFAGRFTGLLLGAAACFAIWLEKGWAKTFPGILLLLAFVLIINLPFMDYGQV